jgi:hypothetical protein
MPLERVPGNGNDRRAKLGRARADLSDAGFGPQADGTGRDAHVGQGGYDPEGEPARLAAAGHGPGDGGLQIVVLGPDTALPAKLQGAEQFAPGPFGKRRVVLGVPAPQPVWVAGGGQLLPRVGPHRLQQAVAAALVRSLLLDDHGLADQGRQAVEDVPPLQAACAGDGDRRGGGEACGEYAQAVKDVPLRLTEQCVRPLDGCLERLMAARSMSDSGRSPKTCSPAAPGGCRLVAKMRTPR